MTELKNVDIICIDTKNITEALLAINKSCECIKFKTVRFFTDRSVSIDKYPNIKNQNFVLHKIQTINSKVEYSKFCLLELSNYIQQDFCLTIQHDGFIACPELWTDQFLDYDYIGAPWPENWNYKNRIGNGGFCFKSKKFLSTSSEVFKHYKFKQNRDKNDITDNEDFLTSVIYYEEFVNKGLKFAPISVATRFSIEHPIKEMDDKAFGFHDKFTEFSKNKMKEVCNGSFL
jgi:hypothetical protein